MMLGEAFPRRRGGRFGKFAKGKERAIVVVPLAGAALSILPRYNTRSPARPSALSPSPFFLSFPHAASCRLRLSRNECAAVPADGVGGGRCEIRLRSAEAGA